MFYSDDKIETITLKMGKEEDNSPYCDICGGCGYIECDSIYAFLRKHVKGKTNCKHESQFISELEWLWEEYKKDV